MAWTRYLKVANVDPNDLLELDGVDEALEQILAIEAAGIDISDANLAVRGNKVLGVGGWRGADAAVAVNAALAVSARRLELRLAT